MILELRRTITNGAITINDHYKAKKKEFYALKVTPVSEITYSSKLYVVRVKCAEFKF